MNLKRMADSYRFQLMATGKRARMELIGLDVNSVNVSSVGSACAYLRGWYVKLSKALGSEEDLKDLKRSLVAVDELKKLVRLMRESERESPLVDTAIFKQYEQAQIELKMAQVHLRDFLLKLPDVIEKCLTHAVRTSGIKLR